MRIYHSCGLLTRIMSLHNRASISRVELSANDYDEVYKEASKVSVSLGKNLQDCPDDDGNITKFKFHGITFRRCENLEDTGMVITV